jgi:hypothetical protein
MINYTNVLDDSSVTLSAKDSQSVGAMISALTPQKSAHSFRRVGPKKDGGYILASDVSAKWVVSVGVGFNPEGSLTEVGMEDLHLAQSGLPVFQFDHTVEGSPYSHPNIHFNKIGLGHSEDGTLISLTEMVEIAGSHSDFGLLMMDCEGAEWDMLVSDDAVDALAPFSQMSIEFHGLRRMASVYSKEFMLAMQNLTRNHVCVSAHVTPDGTIEVFGSRTIPSVLESTFVHKKWFKSGNKSVPESLYVPHSGVKYGYKSPAAFALVK